MSGDFKVCHFCCQTEKLALGVNSQTGISVLWIFPVYQWKITQKQTPQANEAHVYVTSKPLHNQFIKCD